MRTKESIKHETILRGIPASPGIAVGSAYLFTKEIPRVEVRSLNEHEVEGEIIRLTRAMEKSVKELIKILFFAQEKVGDAKARILVAQIMVLKPI